MAFHLHRLNLIGDRLLPTGFLPKSHLRHLTAARLPLAERDVTDLAARLHINVEELRRPLTQPESEEWAFYRSSTVNPRKIWARAHSLWRAAGLSNAEAARILDINKGTLLHCLVGEDDERLVALSHPAASRLASAIGLSNAAAIIAEPDPERASPDR